MSGAHILVIDDEPLMRDFLAETLARNGFAVQVANNGAAGLDQLQEHSFDLCITDIKMPGMDGLEVLDQVRQKSPDTAVVLMTAYASVESAVRALKAGAVDYIMKPFTPDEIEHVVERAVRQRRLEQENRYLREVVSAPFDFQQMIGTSPHMTRIYEEVKRVAASRASVLVRGESGVGKELIARAIHYHSPRREGPFIKVNCAALAPGLLESELFGHEKGSFTHAIAKKIGRFELADEGTLLLDEISEMEPGLQSKLLRVLQEREFERVGGTKPIQVDVRIVSTSNRHLEGAIADGTFREDLFFRLNVVPINIPPLRDRIEDLPLLTEHFVARYSAENGRPVATVPRETHEHLRRHSWPGNVRELQNAIERAVVLADGDTLGPDLFPFSQVRRDPPSTANGIFVPVGTTVAETERQLIMKTLQATSNNKSRTAETLDISVRTLRNKLNEYRGRGLLEEGEETSAEAVNTHAA